MNRTVKIAPVRKSLLVRAPAAHAFEVFTARLGRWWPKSHHIGASLKDAFIEPFNGGRWYEVAEDGAETNVGRVLHWEPPHRLIVSWHVSARWTPDVTVMSEVEVRFESRGSDTLVELEHRNFESLGPEDGASMRKDVDGGWPALLQLFAKEAEAN